MKPPTFHDTKVDEDVVSKVVDAMGVTRREKAKLATNQLKDVAQVWFEQWRDERYLRDGSVDLEVFKRAFLDRFFPIDLRGMKLVKFINLRQGGMTLKKYSLKFTKLSKYARTFVANSRSRMNKFVMGGI